MQRVRRNLEKIPWALAGGTLTLLAVSPLQALAQVFGPSPVNLPPPPVPLTTIPFLTTASVGGPLFYLAAVVLGWIFWVLIVFSVVMALVAAYRYATSAGEPEKVKRAGRTLLYAAVAIVVALIAGGIPYLIGSILGIYFPGNLY